MREMMQLLTGKVAGVKDNNGRYPQGSINYLIQKRIDQLNRLQKTFSSESGKPGKRDFARKNERKS